MLQMQRGGGLAGLPGAHAKIAPTVLHMIPLGSYGCDSVDVPARGGDQVRAGVKEHEGSQATSSGAIRGARSSA